jgi:hypothetical protein
LEAFSTRLCDETDLNELEDNLVGVVRETMQPAYASLWLRPDAAMKSNPGSEKDLTQFCTKQSAETRRQEVLQRRLPPAAPLLH